MGRPVKKLEATHASAKQYRRGTPNNPRHAKHTLRTKIKRDEKRYQQAALSAKQAELLLPTEPGYLETEHELERTYRATQHQIASAVDEQTRLKAYDVALPKLGPYRASFTPSGDRLLLGGRKGHLVVAQWDGGFRLLHEVQVRETVRDVTWLRDQSMFAVAQHKHLYIYDTQGTELHCLRTHKPQVNRLAYLRYHWLLVTVGSTGALRYLDVSTGENVADMRTRLGECDVMRASSYNAVVHLGHANGTVSLWTPNMHEPVAKMLCHKGAVADLAIDRGGRYLATAGRDGTLKVWDVRAFRPLHSYQTPRPVTSLDISDRGLLAAAHGPSVQVFKDGLATRASAPYITHMLPGRLCENVHFAPFEDVLGVGHSAGYTSMLVPGAGEPNFDAREANPYETAKQRRESEVVALLEKLPPETISLNPEFVNTVDRAQKERQKEQSAARAERIAQIVSNKRAKKKTRGRSKAAARAAKKEGNIISEKRERRREQLEKQREKARKSRRARDGALDAEAKAPGEFDPLSRFVI